MKHVKEKQVFLEKLKETPIVQFACRKANIPRSTFYRWKKEDSMFAKAVDTALIEGEDLINDLSESQLVSLIKDRNFQAIQLWLRSHHQKYSNKLEITGSINNANERKLTPDEKKTLALAVKLASLGKKYEQQNKKVTEDNNPR